MILGWSQNEQYKSSIPVYLWTGGVTAIVESPRETLELAVLITRLRSLDMETWTILLPLMSIGDLVCQKL